MQCASSTSCSENTTSAGFDIIIYMLWALWTDRQESNDSLITVFELCGCGHLLQVAYLWTMWAWSNSHRLHWGTVCVVCNSVNTTKGVQESVETCHSDLLWKKCRRWIYSSWIEMKLWSWHNILILYSMTVSIVTAQHAVLHLLCKNIWI